jgi:hypothetical protein
LRGLTPTAVSAATHAASTAGLVAVLGVFVLVLVVLPIVFFVVQQRRARRQHVVVDGGELRLHDSALSGSPAIPTGDIGTVVALPQRNMIDFNGLTGQFAPPQGIWTWGGVIVLDTAGRVVRHLTHVPGGPADPELLAEQIPAPVHVTLDRSDTRPYSRRAFLRRFPGSLGLLQLRGTAWWAITITVSVIIAILLLIAAGILIAAAVSR